MSRLINELRRLPAERVAGGCGARVPGVCWSFIPSRGDRLVMGARPAPRHVPAVVLPLLSGALLGTTMATPASTVCARSARAASEARGSVR